MQSAWSLLHRYQKSMSTCHLGWFTANTFIWANGMSSYRACPVRLAFNKLRPKQDFLEVCSYGPNYQHSSIGWDNGLVTNQMLSEPMMVSLLTNICVTRPQWVNMWFINWFCINHLSVKSASRKGLGKALHCNESCFQKIEPQRISVHL